jgi:OmcA/MtrC family decaheme c-type cytochrome
VLNGGVNWVGNFPQQDTEGALVDNGDGTYQYTFFRDVTQAATIVAGLTDSGFYKKADLGDLTYEPTLTHRLGIILSGSQPGTGTNTADAVQVVAPVPLLNTFNLGYDFVPNGGTPSTTRDIVVKDSCTECHAGKGIGHWSTASATNGVPAGVTVGRNDPRLCVTCHTDQIKYTFDNYTVNNGNAVMAADGITFTIDKNSAGGNAVIRPAQAIIDGRAVGNYPNLVHKMHMGENLVKQGYFFNNASEGEFNAKALPQEPRNCTKCHDGSATATHKTANGDNWKNVPSRLACGACHDGIDYATGTGITLADKANGVVNIASGSGHISGGYADDSSCGSSSCHTPANIALVHQTNTATTHNPVAGAWKNHTTHTVSTITYDIKSVDIVAATVNAVSVNQPVIKFKITVDGTAVTSLPAAPLVTNGTFGQQVVDPNYEPIPGFASGPTFYVAYAVPQDGITAPADFNGRASASLTNMLVASGSPKAGTITGPDTNGYFTATLTGDTIGQPLGAGCVAPTAPTAQTSCVSKAVSVSTLTIPTGAVMVTGAIIGTFTQKNVADYPYTAAVVSTNPTTAASGGLIIKSVLKKLVATGYTARRVITDATKCNACHDQLGTSPEFHGGARNDPTACALCHTPNEINDGAQTKNYGWPGASNTFIHGIHAASKRSKPFTWAAWDFTDEDNVSTVEYPGVVKTCSQCHLPNTVNFGASGTTIAPNMLFTTASAGTSAAVATAGPGGVTNAWALSPWITTLPGWTTATDFGLPPAVSATTGVLSVPSASTNLVNSPMASACFACHDTALAKTHMTGIGNGAIYELRSTATLKTETCLICHGVGREADVEVIHQK